MCFQTKDLWYDTRLVLRYQMKGHTRVMQNSTNKTPLLSTTPWNIFSGILTNDICVYKLLENQSIGLTSTIFTLNTRYQILQPTH
ncbi:hypothetical protein GHT06_006277 [Daphnia sinensis]|uniref:Uncharacterized protein n=1 Tax=Daphnia sinensis TaxID=1820382 RepID=A0AAD5PN30_9CRUS|nr:hypothetical protein GHT06_006277 [Daphnia sinensis]